MKPLKFTAPPLEKLKANRLEERKQETRRKILIGAYQLAKAKQTHTEEELYTAMLNFLTRESDRRLF